MHVRRHDTQDEEVQNKDNELSITINSILVLCYQVSMLRGIILSVIVLSVMMLSAVTSSASVLSAESRNVKCHYPIDIFS
jgi:hypothetical protein